MLRTSDRSIARVRSISVTVTGSSEAESPARVPNGTTTSIQPSPTALTSRAPRMIPGLVSMNRSGISNGGSARARHHERHGAATNQPDRLDTKARQILARGHSCGVTLDEPGIGRGGRGAGRQIKGERGLEWDADVAANRDHEVQPEGQGGGGPGPHWEHDLVLVADRLVAIRPDSMRRRPGYVEAGEICRARAIDLGGKSDPALGPPVGVPPRIEPHLKRDIDFTVRGHGVLRRYQSYLGRFDALPRRRTGCGRFCMARCRHENCRPKTQ